VRLTPGLSLLLILAGSARPGSLRLSASRSYCSASRLLLRQFWILTGPFEDKRSGYGECSSYNGPPRRVAGHDRIQRTDREKIQAVGAQHECCNQPWRLAAFMTTRPSHVNLKLLAGLRANNGAGGPWLRCRLD
jgi:hypothetical protein